MGKDDKSYSAGLDDRWRDLDGETCQKRRGTLLKTLRRTFGANFALGLRGYTRLDTLRDRADEASLSQLLKNRIGE
jgi:hypothetical protein